jgi:hypothetical protein
VQAERFAKALAAGAASPEQFDPVALGVPTNGAFHAFGKGAGLRNAKVSRSHLAATYRPASTLKH